jgi:hypothetical protein
LFAVGEKLVDMRERTGRLLTPVKPSLPSEATSSSTGSTPDRDGFVLIPEGSATSG